VKVKSRGAGKLLKKLAVKKKGSIIQKTSIASNLGRRTGGRRNA